jgi:hypothetical protein
VFITRYHDKSFQLSATEGEAVERARESLRSWMMPGDSVRSWSHGAGGLCLGVYSRGELTNAVVRITRRR